MSSGLYNIGVTGMTAAQMGLVTTQHNIVNASTAGYSRQRIQQASNVGIMTGAGAMGQGTHVTTVTRMYDRFLSQEVNRTQSNVSELDSYYAEISQINNMLADQNAGLSPALQGFFSGLQTVTADATSLTARQSLVSSASTLTARFQGLQTRMNELAAGVNGQIASVVAEINSYSQQIAELNSRIVVAESSVNQPANDLLDQRDQLVSELNKLIQVTTVTDSSGNFNVFVGSGQQLVVGTQVTNMTSAASSADPERIVVGLQTMGGKILELPESLVTGGKLGGLVGFRAETLEPALNKLGTIAASMALTFNAQHALGQDLSGRVTGDAGFVGDFFTIPSPRVVKNAYNSATAPVVSASLEAPRNNGTNFYTDLNGSDYSLVYSGGALRLTRLSDGESWTGANVAAINAQIGNGTADVRGPQGFTINVGAGAFAENDSFIIQPTRTTAGEIAVNAQIKADPRLFAASAPVRTFAALTNAGTMTLSQGVVSQGYSLAGLPLTATTTAIPLPGTGLQLSGFPAGAVATYSDGTTVAGSDLPLQNASAVLSKISFNGMSFDVSGTAVLNDAFTFGRNTASTGIADGRNAVLLGKLQTQTTMSGASANYQAVYAQIVGDVGNKTRETQVTAKAQQALLNQATAAKESLTGVNLDEEAANLIRYQQAYQASAKMLSLGKELFDALLAI